MDASIAVFFFSKSALPTNQSCRVSTIYTPGFGQQYQLSFWYAVFAFQAFPTFSFEVNFLHQLKQVLLNDKGTNDGNNTWPQTLRFNVQKATGTDAINHFVISCCVETLIFTFGSSSLNVPAYRFFEFSGSVLTKVEPLQFFFTSYPVFSLVGISWHFE